MDKVLAYERSLSRFQPLERILTYDDFDEGRNGWTDLKLNHVEENFQTFPSAMDHSRWGPAMLSTATYPFVGTHGSMEGLYSLKLTTRPVVAPYEEPPRPGSLSQALKRLTWPGDIRRLQLELWFAYTPEQDRPGLGEQDIRAIGVMFDLQDSEHRYFPGVRYLNSVNGKLVQKWQYTRATNMDPIAWTHGSEGEWFKPGIDPQWYGRRHPDGTHEGFQDMPNGHQLLCYNETSDKINWLYMRMLLDVDNREYVEFQSGNRTIDMRGLKPTLVEPYANLEGLINPSIWIENDANRRAFLYLDSVLVSYE